MIGDMIRREASRVPTGRHAAWGTVSSYDPDAYTARVVLQPGAVETGWLPILSQWVGNGWGMLSPPSVGDAVLVVFEDGSRDAGCIVLSGFNVDDRPPPGAPSGEFWLVHRSGSAIKLKNDGAVEVKASGNASISVGGNATIAVAGAVQSSASAWQHDGPVSIAGQVSIVGQLAVAGPATVSGPLSSATLVADPAGTLATLRGAHNAHTHTSASPGNPTGLPSQ